VSTDYKGVKMPNSETKKKEKKGILRLAVRGFIGIPLLTAMIFVLAGRVTYWQGWVLSGLCVLLVFILIVLFADKTELLRERRKPGPGTKLWDKVLLAFYAPAFYAILIIGVLDAGRFGWTNRLPVFVYTIGYVIFIFSNFCYLWAMWTNRWFSSTVRIQKERDQKVVQDGPYKIIRHPGYIGGILMSVSLSLILGSLRALIPAGIVIILLVLRTYLEDITLQKELPGYADYTQKVKYRLLPGIW